MYASAVIAVTYDLDLCDLPLTLKTIEQFPFTWRIISDKFHWNPQSRRRSLRTSPPTRGNPLMGVNGPYHGGKWPVINEIRYMSM